MARRHLFTIAALAAGCGRVGFADQDAAIGDGVTNDAAVTACVAGETAGVATTDFAAGAPSWSKPYTTVPTLLDFPAGQMRVTPGMTNNADAYSGIAGPVGDYTGHRVFVHVPAMVNTATCAQASLLISEELASSTYFELDQSCDELTAHHWIAGVDNRIARVPYDPVAHAWWEIRITAARTYFETSPDGVAWTPVGSVPTPSFVTHAYVDLGAGTYRLESGTIGAVIYDDLGECFTP